MPALTRYAQAREAAWKRMSEAGRSQFAWPEPGIPRLEGDPPLEDVDAALIQDSVRVAKECCARVR